MRQLGTTTFLAAFVDREYVNVSHQMEQQPVILGSEPYRTFTGSESDNEVESFCGIHGKVCASH